MENIFKFMLQDFKLNDRSQALYYNVKEIETKMAFLHSLSQDNKDFSFLFPLKSFPDEKIIEKASRYVDGFDVSNQQELDLCSKYINKQSIVWSSAPFVTNWDSCNKEMIIDINHIDEIGSYSDDQTLSLRIKLDNISKISTRFGVDFEKIKELVANNKRYNHFHTHLGNLDNSFDEYIQILDCFKELTKLSDQKLTFNFGGGFVCLSQDEIARVAKKALKELAGHRIIFEPGRWLSEESGFAIGKVLSLNDNFLMTSISPNCHLRWISEKPNFRIIPKNKDISEQEVEYTIVGPTCDERDRLAKIKSKLSNITVGDFVIVGGVSGYCATWNHSFNGIPKADIVHLF